MRQSAYGTTRLPVGSTIVHAAFGTKFTSTRSTDACRAISPVIPVSAVAIVIVIVITCRHLRSRRTIGQFAGVNAEEIALLAPPTGD